MAYGAALSRRERAAAMAATALGVLLVGLVLLTGMGRPGVHAPSDSLTVITLGAPPPPQPEEHPRAAATPRPEGAAAPPNLRADPTPIVAPKLPPLVEPPPVVAAPVAGTGSAGDAGAAPRPGPGTGVGGEGSGLGAGNGGSGTGGGGGASRPRWVSGTIRSRDYPRAASRADIGGSVTVHFTVTAQGRVRDCRVVRSSGNADLDGVTCRLIEQRFRYRPARDAAGRAVESVAGWRQDWWLEDARGG